MTIYTTTAADLRFSIKAPNAGAACRLMLQQLRRQIAAAKRGEVMMARRGIVALEGQCVNIEARRLFGENEAATLTVVV